MRLAVQWPYRGGAHHIRLPSRNLGWDPHLQGKVELEGFVEGGEGVSGYETDTLAHAFYGDGADLFGLRLRIAFESGDRRFEQHLERVDAPSVDRSFAAAGTEPRRLSSLPWCRRR